MTIIRATLDPSNPPRFTAEELERLDAKTDEELTRAAEEDPDNPPLTDDEFVQIHTIQIIRRLRARFGLQGEELAHRFGIDPEKMKSWERGDQPADRVGLSYLRVIEHDPDTVLRALAKVAA